MDEVKAKKSLGQHWLFDSDVLSDMVELAEVAEDDFVVEIGPGLGTLTKYLLGAGASVTAVEFDEELSVKLAKTKVKLFGKDSLRLTVTHQGILKFRFDQLPPDYKVVANIPYYLTSNLIRVLSETSNRPRLIVLLIQKEVAQRLCAKPGNMSLLSVWAQMYFECSLGSVVPSALFTPPPNVDSQIVTLKRLSSPLFQDTNKKILSGVIKAGFSNKRKTLHNSLAAGLLLEKSLAKKLLIQSNIHLQARPQELSLEEWLTLTRAYLKRNI